MRKYRKTYSLGEYRKTNNYKPRSRSPRLYNPRSSYTDFGAGFLSHIGETEPHFFGHTVAILFGLFCLFADQFSGSFFFALGLGSIIMGIVGYKEDAEKCRKKNNSRFP